MEKIRKKILQSDDLWSSKLLKIMKNTLVILLLAVGQVIATESYSQTTALSLNMKNASIKEVMNQIENKSEFYFLYSSKLIDVERKVNINVSNEKISKILDQLFEGTDIIHTVLERQIVLAPKMLTETTTQQQGKTITGTVKDSNGQPLPGVTVVVKGTSVGIVTDSNGKYSISLPEKAEVLVFSFVGMKH